MAAEILDLDGCQVSVSNPDKVFFPKLEITKMQLVEYYLAVSAGALTGCRERPTSLKRYPNGAEGEFFFQKRVPKHRPEWIQTALVHFPSGRSAEFLVITNTAHLVWAVNLGCIDLNPWPVRRADLDHPDEMRVDIDPTEGVPFSAVCEAALIAGDVLREHKLEGFPKTSGSRGMHINVRIEPEWDFTEVRRAALAMAREVERRAPGLATTAWWKEQRRGVFLDYNQNARDRTVASAYSVRPVGDARVSCPVAWEEVEDLDPARFTLLTVPSRLQDVGDPSAGIDQAAGRLDSLLELARIDEREGLGDAPWPPHFPKGDREPPRVAPSRAKKDRQMQRKNRQTLKDSPSRADEQLKRGQRPGGSLRQPQE